MTRPYVGQTVLYYRHVGANPVPRLVTMALRSVEAESGRPCPYVTIAGHGTDVADSSPYFEGPIDCQGQVILGYCTPIPEEVDREARVDAALKMLREQLAEMKELLDRVRVVGF